MDRNVVALNFLADYSLGTLWNIKETLWKERIHDDEGYDSNRVWHPGLSIRRTRLTASYEMVPMLHGTSRGSKRTCVVVKGVTESEGNDKKTFFGRIFAPIQITDFLFDRNAISKNTYKSKIDDDEMNQLEKWLKRKGL